MSNLQKDCNRQKYVLCHLKNHLKVSMIWNLIQALGLLIKVRANVVYKVKLPLKLDLREIYKP